MQRSTTIYNKADDENEGRNAGFELGINAFTTILSQLKSQRYYLTDLT